MFPEDEEDIVICNTADIPSPFLHGNVNTTCALCGVAIYHRYHAPAKAKKVCIGCGLAELEKRPDGVEITVTKETLEELHLDGPSIKRQWGAH